MKVRASTAKVKKPTKKSCKQSVTLVSIGIGKHYSNNVHSSQFGFRNKEEIIIISKSLYDKSGVWAPGTEGVVLTFVSGVLHGESTLCPLGANNHPPEAGKTCAVPLLRTNDYRHFDKSAGRW